MQNKNIITKFKKQEQDTEHFSRDLQISTLPDLQKKSAVSLFCIKNLLS